MKVELDLSPELGSLVKGFAGYHGKTVKQYIIDCLLSDVQADSEASHERDTPEASARAGQQRRRP